MNAFNRLLAVTAAVFFAMNMSPLCQADDLDAQYAADLLKPGTEAPEIIASDLQGKQHKLSDLRGKYIVIDFWASWCPDCVKDIPVMKKLYETYGSEVVFLGVSFDHDKAKWEGCVAKNEIKWLQISTLERWKENPISADFHIKWIPSMYVIDPDGKVVLGTVMIDKLEKTLKKITE